MGRDQPNAMGLIRCTSTQVSQTPNGRASRAMAPVNDTDNRTSWADACLRDSPHTTSNRKYQARVEKKTQPIIRRAIAASIRVRVVMARVSRKVWSKMAEASSSIARLSRTVSASTCHTPFNPSVTASMERLPGETDRLWKPVSNSAGRTDG